MATTAAILNVFFSETACAIFRRYHMELSVERVLTICTNSCAPLNKMAAMPINGKKTYFFLQNQESFEAESWYLALGTHGLLNLFK